MAHTKPSNPPRSKATPIGFLSPAPIEAKQKRWPNKYEQTFADMARQLGWDITKRGWPDFLCYAPNGGMIAVEVKPPLVPLRRSQWLCMKALASAGVKCFVTDGETLVPFDPDLPLGYEDE